jgi:hypothetical protein
MEKGPLPWASAGPVGDNLYKWKAIIEGPVRFPRCRLFAAAVAALPFSCLDALRGGA